MAVLWYVSRCRICYCGASKFAELYAAQCPPQATSRTLPYWCPLSLTLLSIPEGFASVNLSRGAWLSWTCAHDGDIAYFRDPPRKIQKALVTLDICLLSDMMNPELPQTSASGIEADREPVPGVQVPSRWPHGSSRKAAWRLSQILLCKSSAFCVSETLAMTACACDSEGRPACLHPSKLAQPPSSKHDVCYHAAVSGLQ